MAFFRGVKKRLQGDDPQQLKRELQWLQTQVGRYKGKILAVGLLSLTGTVMGLISSVASKYLIDAVTGYGADMLWRAVAIMAVMLLGSLVLQGVSSRVGASGNRYPIAAGTRGVFAYVPQGNSVFPGTIAENLRLVSPDATDGELEQALKIACAWDFVSQFPDGVNHRLGTGGRGISEGQAQRLAIARALLRGLKLSNQLTDTVCSLVREQFFPLRQDTLLEALMRMGPEGVERMLLLRSACAQACHPGRAREIQAQFTVLEQARRQLIAQNACFSLKQLAVKGPDLTAQGLRGPQIGQALQQLLALVAQGRLPNEKEALLAALRNITRE